jgi:hypothetical protein
MAQPDSLRRKQGGAVAIMVGLAIFVLVAVIGLVLDLGHLYIAKTELQNAADACALSAARELSDLSGDALGRATNAGIVVGGGCPAGLVPCPDTAFRNKINLQGATVDVQPADVAFASTLAGPYSRPDPLPVDTRYVRCAPQETNPTSFVMWFMGVMGISSGSVSAEAVARLSPSQAACAIPLGLCTEQTAKGSPSPNWGFVEGKWYDGRFGAGGGSTGSYNWIDFSPKGGGTNELKDLLAGEGQCEVPTSQCVGEQGEKQGAANAWNTRFGLYKGSYDPATNRMDWTGFAYTATSWPAGTNAYADFLDPKRASHIPYQGNASGLSLHGFRTSSSAAHAAGADRRMVAAPVVHCQDWIQQVPSCAQQTVPIRDWACVLMLNPIDGPDDVMLEFLGMASEIGSPCATLGMPGGGGIGPQVPTLVR